MDYFGNAPDAKKYQKSMRLNSILTSSKLSVCQLLIILFQFVSKAKRKITTTFCSVDAKTIADWNVRLRDVRIRMPLKFSSKLGGKKNCSSR